MAVFRRRLRTWYGRHARDLPWRRSADAYSVWLSEIMLQQTQVETVKGYFERFMAAFPDVATLASADEQQVLRLWEGLGYYRRARQLHRAAQVIVEQHDGRFPDNVESVRRLPGIGRYTAGAILSIAFGQRQPILEANTLRLFARLLAFRGQTMSAEGQRLLWAMAEAVLPQRDVGTFNQALMELGSEVCGNHTPRCTACPAASLCAAHRQGLEKVIPAPKPRPVFEEVYEVAVVVRRRGRLLLRRCPEGQRWAGLWDFPRVAVTSSPDADAPLRREIVEAVRQLTGVEVALGNRVKTLKHGVTRYRITLDCFEAQYVAHVDGAHLNGVSDSTEMKWLRPAELEGYPLSTTGRKLAKLFGKAES